MNYCYGIVKKVVEIIPVKNRKQTYRKIFFSFFLLRIFIFYYKNPMLIKIWFIFDWKLVLINVIPKKLLSDPQSVLPFINFKVLQDLARYGKSTLLRLEQKFFGMIEQDDLTTCPFKIYRNHCLVRFSRQELLLV